MKLSELLQDKYEPYVVIKIPSNVLVAETINESEWRPSQFKDMWYRVDSENPAIPQQRHVHIAHKKHISTPNMQVSWNIDQSRHDAHKFNSSFTGVEKAKDLARQVLKLPSNAILEQKYLSTTKAGLILERLESTLPSGAISLVFHYV